MKFSLTPYYQFHNMHWVGDILRNLLFSSVGFLLSRAKGAD
jgi:hypothetical protein